MPPAASMNRPLGWWRPGPEGADGAASALGDALARLDQPVTVVEQDGRLAVARGGTATLGGRPAGHALPLRGTVPALHPDQLGDPAFRASHGLRYAYVAGAMANGISSVELVVAMARAGMLGFFGAAGLAPTEVAAAIDRIAAEVPSLPWGANLIHTPSEPEIEQAIVALYLDRGVRCVSASAYLDLTLPLVRYRLAGIHAGPDGAVVAPNRVLAKVSRSEVARKFLSPAPARFVAALVEEGSLTPEQAELAARIPVAEDVTAEADSGGHTDNRPLVVLLPRLQAVRDELQERFRYRTVPRVGAAGGLGTPRSVAAAFGLGAAYVVTGSINQGCREAGTSDRVRAMLATAGPTDVTMAPAADMFEMGVELQVLGRGTLFPVRARRLYALYKQRGSIEALTEAERTELEQKIFKRSLDAAWADTARFWEDRDPTQLDKAEQDPRHRMALLFRSYLGLSSRWANAGVPERAVDFQIWCGPAMGAFNRWAEGGRFARWEDRNAVPVARNLLVGAAVATRAAALRTQGVPVPVAAERFVAIADEALDALLDVPWEAPEEQRVEAEVVERPDAIAIVGMSCLFPKAADLATFWRNLRTGVDAIGEVPDRDGYWRAEDYFDPDPSAPDMLYTTRGGFIDPVDFDPTEFGIPPTILEATDTSQLLGLLVASRALEDAGYGPGVEWNKDRASVILGVTGTQELVVNLGARLGHPRWRKALAEAGVDADTAEDVVERIARSYVSWQENSFPGLLGNVVAGRIANRLDLGGTNCVIDAACASSLGAIEMGVMELRTGRSDVVVTGGVDTLNDVFMYQCFTATPALSKTGDARPFDRDGDGTILGEGIGIVVLKRLADAERDGDRIHAVLTGIGSSSDGRAKSIYAPRSSGQARALRAAYAEAGVSPSEIDLVEAHGTGTKAGDATEVAGLASVYEGVDTASVALGSVKSMIGHTKASAGAAGLIKAALALEHRVLPPTLKVRQPLPALEDGAGPFYVNTAARPWRSQRVRRAAVSAFGFGGSNFHAVLEEYGHKGVSWDGAVELVAASAADPAGLAARLREAVSEDPASTRERFRSRDAARAVVVIEAGVDRADRLERAATLAAVGADASTPDGIVIGFGDPGRLALIFPGQGSQYVGMGAEVACVFPEALAALDAEPAARWAHPPTVFGAEAADAQEAALRSTDVAQPALGAMEAGLLAVLRRFGVSGDAFAGHSYGELVALHAAGVLDADGLRAASRARGRLMAGNGKDRGTMLAILAPLADAEAAVEAVGGGLVLANRNTPEQGVAAGSRAAIDALVAACAERGLRTKRLSVGAGFHSPLVADAEPAFAAALAEIAVQPPAAPVFANTTAAPYPDDADGIRALLAGQIARPVAWVDLVTALADSGVSTFVEVGPRRALTGMVGRILADRAHRAVALDASSGRGSGLRDLALGLAAIAAAGHPIDLAAWERRVAAPRADQITRRRPRMAVPLSGANHRDPVEPLPPRAPRRVVTPTPPPPVAGPPPAPRTDRPTMSQPTDPQTAALLVQALQGAQEQLRTLQAMQQQTAAVHQTFLAGQAAAQASFQALLDGQQRLISQSLGLPTVPQVAARQVAPVAIPQVAVPQVAIPQVAIPQVAIPQPAPVAYAPPAAAPVAPAPVAAPAVVAPAPVAAAPAPVAAPVAVAPAAPAAAVDTIGTLLAVVAEATGYPVDMLELDMDLESDLGIDSIKRVEILSMLGERLPDAPTVEPERLGGLHTLRQVLDFVAGGAPPAAEPEPALASAPERRAVTAVPFVDAAADRPLPLTSERAVWVLDDGTDLSELLTEALRGIGVPAALVSGDEVPEEPPGGLILLGGDLGAALRVLRAAGPTLRDDGGFLLSVSRLDGGFGTLDATGYTAGDAVQSGLAGFVKSAAWEWPSVWCRALDLAAAISDEDAVRAIGAELRSAGPVEVGLGADGVRRSLQLVPLDAPVTASAAPEGLVLVTGGARGVTAECAVALAEAGAPTLLLVGRSALPDPEPEWLAAAQDDAALTQALLTHGFDSRPGPRELRERMTAVRGAREIRETLARIEAAGATVSYAAADVRNAKALEKAIRSAERATKTKLRGVLHGAGVLRDKLIVDKSDADLELVLSTKVDGLRAVLAAVGGRPLDFLGLFTSVTGRFGRKGQADYAAANRVLDALASREAARRPDTRVVAWSWGPWDGGMVTPALKKAFESEGVALIPRAGGALVCAEEVAAAPGRAVQIVVGDGLDAGHGSAEPTPVSVPLRLDPEQWTVLQDHQLDGQPVLPMALAMEFLARAARNERGDHGLIGLEDVRVLKGVVLDAATDLRPVCGAPVVGAAAVTVPVELVDADGRVRVRGLVKLRPPGVAPDPAPSATGEPGSLQPWPGGLPSVYGQALFHGPAFQCIAEVVGTWESGIVVEVGRTPPPSAWLPGDRSSAWSVDPLVVDGIFQSLILWCRVAAGAPSLPSRVAAWQTFAPLPATVRLIATVRRRRGASVLADIDVLSLDGALVARMEGYTCTAAASLERAFSGSVAAEPGSAVAPA